MAATLSLPEQPLLPSASSLVTRSPAETSPMGFEQLSGDDSRVVLTRSKLCKLGAAFSWRPHHRHIVFAGCDMGRRATDFRPSGPACDPPHRGRSPNAVWDGSLRGDGQIGSAAAAAGC